MLAYVSWHRPAPGQQQTAYEQALEHFHRSLAHRPPSGFRGSVTYRAGEVPWLGWPDGQEDRSGQGYEDWYLLDGWSAVGVMEEAATSRGHITAHDDVARRSGITTGAVYRLSEGHARLGDVRVSAWVSRPAGRESPTLSDLLGDGMDEQRAGLWRRCIGLGPAPEYCLLAPATPDGVSPERLPLGWEVSVSTREVLWNG